MPEIVRVAGDEAIGLALGGGDCLHGIPQNRAIRVPVPTGEPDDLQAGRGAIGEIDQNGGGFLLPQMFGQQVMQGG